MPVLSNLLWRGSCAGTTSTPASAAHRLGLCTVPAWRWRKPRQASAQVLGSSCSKVSTDVTARFELKSCDSAFAARLRRPPALAGDPASTTPAATGGVQ